MFKWEILKKLEFLSKEGHAREIISWAHATVQILAVGLRGRWQEAIYKKGGCREGIIDARDNTTD